MIDSNNQTRSIWRATDRNTKQWKRERVSLNDMQSSFRIYFETISDDSTNNQLLGIDDTGFLNCQTFTTVPCFNNNLFECFNGRCIPNNYVI